MTEERSTHPEEPGKKPRPWRPTYRQVFWAIGMVVTLMTITLLVAGLYPDIWQALSRERVMLIGIGVALVVVIVLLAMGGAALGWTGFRGKTLWDLLQLLVVPLVLVGIGFLFEMQQAERQGGMEERQQALEDQRAKAERKLAEQRAQDEALQAYLDQMSTLLLEEKDLRNDRVRTLMRARTLTVLGRLDPSRKTAVTQFLVEAELVQRVDGRDPIISLEGANLSDADLAFADLGRANLAFADLSGAALSDANLSDAILFNVNLNDADLRGAALSDANLSDADLNDADLRGAALSDANLSRANLSRASLSRANLSGAQLGLGAILSEAQLSWAILSEADMSYTDLSYANLQGANLQGTNLQGAGLQEANLAGARLQGANLSEAKLWGGVLHGARLQGANLQDALGWTEEQLTAARALKEATMPDGQILKSDDNPEGPTFEEWLKSRGRKGNAENE